jgi:hypothetical protein
MRTGRVTGRAVSTKRVKTLVAIALGMALALAGMGPASAASPNALFQVQVPSRG